MANEAIRVKVVCRVRPLNEKERASGDESVVKFPTAACVTLGVRGDGSCNVFCQWLVETLIHNMVEISNCVC